MSLRVEECRQEPHTRDNGRRYRKIKNWKPEGMGAPTTFGPDRRHGVNGIRIMHAEKGKHVPVTDYVIFKPLF
jgi:hypothetical protein